MWPGDSSLGHSGRQGDHGERLGENSAPPIHEHGRQNSSNVHTPLSQWNDVYHNGNISLTTLPSAPSLPAAVLFDEFDAIGIDINLQQSIQDMQILLERPVECPEATEMSSSLPSTLDQHDPCHGPRLVTQPPAAATTFFPTSGRMALQSAQDTRDYQSPFLEYFDTAQSSSVVYKANSDQAQSKASSSLVTTYLDLHSQMQPPGRVAQGVQDTRDYQPPFVELFGTAQPSSVACKANSDQVGRTASNSLVATYPDSQVQYETEMISHLRLETNPQQIQVPVALVSERAAFGVQLSNRTSMILTDAVGNTQQTITPTFEPGTVGSFMQSEGMPPPVQYGNCDHGSNNLQSSMNKLGLMSFSQLDTQAASMQMTAGIGYTQPSIQQQLHVSQFLQQQNAQQEELFEQNQILFNQFCQKSGNGIGISPREASSNNQVTLPSKKQKRVQDPGFPKRPLTAYNLFFKDERAKMLGIVEFRNREGGGEQSRELGCQQHDDTDDLQHPLLPGTQLKLGSDAHLAVSWDGTDQATGQDERKCSSRYKKPKVRIGFAEMARRVSAEWKQANAETKSMYQAQAAQDKARYEREKNEYLQTVERGQGAAHKERQF